MPTSIGKIENRTFSRRALGKLVINVKLMSKGRTKYLNASSTEDSLAMSQLTITIYFSRKMDVTILRITLRSSNSGMLMSTGKFHSPENR